MSTWVTKILSYPYPYPHKILFKNLLGVNGKAMKRVIQIMYASIQNKNSIKRKVKRL